MAEQLKIGVFGGRRGEHLAQGAKANGLKVTAICDANMDLLRVAAGKIGGGCRTYTSFEEMLSSDIDAVVLANYATEHVPAAKLALAAGKHVLSECMACFTMAEAVELAEAVEASGKIYMISENYPFSPQNLELKRRFGSGEFGKFVYGEAEYIHPIAAAEVASLCGSPGHWRTWLAASYYCTHSMGPVMEITGTRPVAVSGMVLPYDFDDPEQTGSIFTNDTAAILMCQMDNGAVVKIMPWAKLRDHGQRVRICGNRGTLEYNQGDDRVRIHRERFDFPENAVRDEWVRAEFPPEFREALNFGHGGGDYFTSHYFAKAIRTGVIEPRLDVYSALAMTVIGIQGYRSALDSSRRYEIPDFRLREVRDRYRTDHWNNDPARQSGEPVPASVLGKIEPSAAALADFRQKRAEFEQKLRDQR